MRPTAPCREVAHRANEALPGSCETKQGAQGWWARAGRAPGGGVRPWTQNPSHWWSSSASIPAPRIPAMAWCSRAGRGSRRSTAASSRRARACRWSAASRDIHARVCDLIREHEPAALAVEDLYFGRNAHSAFAVGQARGVVLLSAGMAGIPCFSYTPQAVKQAVCGTGSAAKDQVQRMVGTLLSLPEPPQPRPRGRRARRGDLPRERRAA